MHVQQVSRRGRQRTRSSVEGEACGFLETIPESPSDDPQSTPCEATGGSDANACHSVRGGHRRHRSTRRQVYPHARPAWQPDDRDLVERSGELRVGARLLRGHTYGIDSKEALQARLDDLIDECDSLLNGRALRALRKIDPHAAIGILKNFDDKRDSIRHPSAFVGAAAKKTGARGHGTQQEAVAEVLAQLRDPRNVDGQVWIPNYKERYSGLQMSLRELLEKHTDKFVIHYDGHTKFHVSLCHTGHNKRLMPWRTGRAARRRATNAAF